MTFMLVDDLIAAVVTFVFVWGVLFLFILAYDYFTHSFVEHPAKVSAIFALILVICIAIGTRLDDLSPSEQDAPVETASSPCACECGYCRKGE